VISAIITWEIEVGREYGLVQVSSLLFLTKRPNHIPNSSSQPLKESPNIAHRSYLLQNNSGFSAMTRVFCPSCLIYAFSLFLILIRIRGAHYIYDLQKVDVVMRAKYPILSQSAVGCPDPTYVSRVFKPLKPPVVDCCELHRYYNS
jgi:hypothetical protein